MEKAQELLQATSNVIELKAGHFYLLVFQGRVRSEDLSFLGKVLKANGMDSVSIALQEGDELQVIEVEE